jgi:hypothetical protein
VTGFPSCFENQTVGEGERKTPASTEQPVMDLMDDYQESVNLP